MVLTLALAGCSDDGGGSSATGGGEADVGASGEDFSEVGGGGSCSRILIVTTDSLAAVAQEHASYRHEQCHGVEVLKLSQIWGDTAPRNRGDAVDAIKEAIATRYEAHTTDSERAYFVLLLGDDVETWAGDAAFLPAGRYDSAWHGEGIPSDNVYADIDGDDAPDVAMGRIPARTADEAALVLQRTRDYETNAEHTVARRRLDLFAGEAGFSEDIDSALETAFYEAVEDFSYDFDVSMTYANTNSPYGYPEDLISDRIYEILNGGPLMSAYIGHGGSGGIGVLDETQIDEKLECPSGRPLMLSIACYTGAFENTRCLAEELLFSEAGPVIVYAASDVSHPAHNAELIYGSGDGLLNLHIATAGELIVYAEREMMLNEGGFYEFITSAATLFEEPEDLEALIPAHAHMYTLFGDPALVIGYPEGSVSLDIADSPRVVGQPLTVEGCTDAVAEGQAYVTLESQRGAILGELRNVPDSGLEPEEAIVYNNETANNKVVSSVEAQLVEGCFEIELPVPETSPPARYWVKVYVSGEGGDAVGSTAVSVTD